MKTSRHGYKNRFSFTGNNSVVSRRANQQKKWSDAFVLNLTNRIARGELTLETIRNLDQGLWMKVYNMMFDRFAQEFIMTYLREIAPEIQAIIDLLEIPYNLDFADYLTPEIKKTVLSNGKVIKQKIYSWSPDNLWSPDDELSRVEKYQLKIDELMYAANNQLNAYQEDLLPACKQALSRNAMINYDLLGVYRKDLESVINSFEQTRDSINEFQECLSNLNKTLKTLQEPRFVETTKEFHTTYHFNGTIRHADIPSKGTKMEPRIDYEDYKTIRAFFSQAQKIILSMNDKILKSCNINMDAWVRLERMLDMLEQYSNITYENLKEITNG